MEGPVSWFGLSLLLVLLAEVVWLSLTLARRLGGLLFAVAIGKCACGVAVFAVTEILSSMGALGHGWIVSTWSALALLGGLLTRRGRGLRLPGVTLRTAQRPAVLAVGAILLGTLLIALLAPPNTWDAVTYHNARVVHWLDHRSVEPYFTGDERQVRMPPLASYMRLHLFALAGGDWLFNLPQWFFFAATVAEVGLWTSALGVRGFAVALAMLLVATQPMAILQASTSQNDLIVGGYFVSAVCLLTQRARLRHRSAAGAALLGCCVGLAAVTKGAGYVLGVIVLSILGVASFREGRAAVGRFLLAALIALAFNAPHLWRITRWYGTPLPHTEVETPGAWAPPVLVGSVLSKLRQNALLQLDLIAVLIGPGDGPPVALSEDSSGSTLHFLLALLATSLAGRRSRLRTTAGPPLVIGWLSWSALALAIKLMPWNTRLQLPALLLFSVPCSIWLGDRPRRHPDIPRMAATILVICCLPYLLCSTYRPLLPVGGAPALLQLSRWENLFRVRPELRPAVERFMSELPADCSRRLPVGLSPRGEALEYLLWSAPRGRGQLLSFRYLEPSSHAPVCVVLKNPCVAAPLCWEPPGGVR